MEKNRQMQIFKAVLDHKISQLARKYTGELVFKIWEEIKTGGRDQAYLSVCGWKSEMTLMEALECLEDYCDFIEAMIRKHQEKEKEEVITFLPSFNNFYEDQEPKVLQQNGDSG